MKSFDQVNERFEKAVRKLQENLQYLADQGKVSDRFLKMQNQILKTLINYQHEVMNTLEAYDQMAIDLSLKNSSEYRKLLDAKESFEAICIIHGIMDFPCWMAKGKRYLIGEAVTHYHNGETQLSSSIMELVNELPANDRELLWSVLNKKAETKWKSELRKLGLEIKAYA
jgi:hypothetical protein